MFTKFTMFIFGVTISFAGIVSTEIFNNSNFTIPDDHLLRGTTIPVLTQDELWEMEAMQEAITAPRIGKNGEDRTVYQPREGSGAGRKDFTKSKFRKTRSYATLNKSNIIIVVMGFCMMIF